MRPLRFFLFWLCAFASVYGLNVLAVTAWIRLGYHNAYLVSAMAATPLVYLLFGWLYYRPGFARKRSRRIVTALVWIVFDFLAGMIVLSRIQGLEPADMFSLASLVVESVNFIALLVASYLCVKHEPPPASGVGLPSARSPSTSPPSSDQRPLGQG